MKRQFTYVLVAMLLVESGAFGREVVRADWDAFRKQVEARGLTGRSARIVLTSGKHVSTTIVAIDDMALDVRSNRATNTRIPREQLRSVRFNGRTGSRGRLIGALSGLSAGAAIGTAVAYRVSGPSGPQQIIAPVAGVAIAATGLLAGYFIGRTADKLAPEFVIQR